MTSEELYNKIRILEPACDEVIPDNIKRNNDYCIELIRQAKKEWELKAFSEGWDKCEKVAKELLKIK